MLIPSLSGATPVKQNLCDALVNVLVVTFRTLALVPDIAVAPCLPFPRVGKYSLSVHFSTWLGLCLDLRTFHKTQAYGLFLGHGWAFPGPYLDNP